MAHKSEGQLALNTYRPSLRRRLNNLPPAKKAELVLFATVGLGFCGVAALYFV